MNVLKKWLVSNIPTLGAIIVFVVLVFGTQSYVNHKNNKWEKDVRNSLYEVLASKKSLLEKALYSRIYYTRGIAAYVSYKPDITTQDYMQLTKEYIGQDKVINSMALSKDCIITAIYPEQGHEEALGLNLLEHPHRKEIVDQTIRTKKTFVAGPVELVEGGNAFISYTPIFDKSKEIAERFWGVTDIVIHRDKLFAEVGLMTFQDGLRFALKGYDGKGENGAFFWGDSTVFADKPVTAKVTLPDGNWVIGVVPNNGWASYMNQDSFLRDSLFLTSLIISILIWFLIRAEFRMRNYAKDLKAMFSALDNLIVEFNEKGDYVKIAPIKPELLILPPKELLGKNLKEVFDAKIATYFQGHLDNCLQSKGLVVCEYPLIINGEELWFHGRFSYKSRHRAIFTSYEVTEGKKASLLIEKNAKELKELNSMKDKLFSIVGHDLRTPILTMNQLLPLLLSRYDDLTDDKRKEIIESSVGTVKNISTLLDNLLNWSHSQRNAIYVKKENVNASSLFYGVIDLLKDQAGEKSISLTNNIAYDISIECDKEITETVARNLITNAIKFTNEGGEVAINAIGNTEDNTVQISVKDSGIGMNDKTISELFTVVDTKVSVGTKGEKGSGIGLMLCKEFITLQNGEIGVESTEGIGSTFWFTVKAALDS